LTKLKALNRDVHLVVFVGRDGEALSPDMETTLAHLKKLTKDTWVHLYDKFVDVDNPLEADLLRYISMTRKDPVAVMVWYQGKGAWANGPNMLSTVNQLVDYALKS